MSHREAVLKEAMQLTAADRAFLAQALLNSVEEPADELTEAQKRVLLKRQAQMKADPSLGIPWPCRLTTSHG